MGPHYDASNAGIIGLIHSYANLLAEKGITVSAVAPALVETDKVRETPGACADLTPVGRFGRVEEVSDVVLILVSNGYMTGQTITVNGGWYMSRGRSLRAAAERRGLENSYQPEPRLGNGPFLGRGGSFEESETCIPY